MTTTLSEHLSLMLSNNIVDIVDHLMLEDVDSLNDYECYACYSVAEHSVPIDEYVLEYYNDIVL
jgi:hypothetical protein